MRRLLALCVLAALLAALLLRPPPAAVVETVAQERLDAALRPADLPISAAETDVVLALTCTLRRDRLEPYGATRPTTPFLRQLAAAGVTFDSHVAQAAWTRPSVGSILTGRYPRVLRLDQTDGDAYAMVLSGAFTTLAESLQSAGYRTIGAVGNPNAKAQFGLAQGFDAYDEPTKTFGAGIRERMPRGDDLVDFVLDEIRATPADQRIFAQVIFVDSHQPVQYRLRHLLLWPRIWTDSRDYRLDAYDAAVRGLDGVLARFFSEVRALRPNSLFVQVADHGEGLSHPTAAHRNGHGGTLYQSVIGIPHIIQHPALPAPGRRVSDNTRNIDVLPSILDLLGVPVSWDLDGESYAAVLRDPDATLGRRLAFTESFAYGGDVRGLLNGQWHYINDVGGERRALYRQDDPDARRDLIDEEPSIAWLMQGRIDAWEAEHDAIAEQYAAETTTIDDDTRRMLETMGYVE
jgi:arylsulfatase A-like enzyme